ncbi:hypothetical protein LTS18_008226 [Coniosporium uncinatum]|uniref:Uncharacterized protein n=1 Tax=Coniosporium uncinatum TaxID=93489 RepID=A0ACC3D1Q3_9PEZI|nr:hypothetical protein LTS18_008226 [Coniosporium uncinatum]
MTSRPTAYAHPTDGSTLLPILKSFLPQSYSLYRRLQCPFRSPHSYVLASFPLTTTTPPPCFAALYLDRSCRPETECWIFLSSEAPSHSPPADPNQPSKDPSEGEWTTEPHRPCPNCTAALTTLLHHIHTTLPFSASIHAAELSGSTPPPNPGSQKYTHYVHTPSILLLGSVHASTASTLGAQHLDLIRQDLPGFQTPYTKFLFRTEGPESVRMREVARRPLPAGLRWGTLTRGEEFELVRRRTEIPRFANTMAGLRSVGVFPEAALSSVRRQGGGGGGEAGGEAEQAADDMPIAWAFLGPDASLSALHVEPEFRGKGLAKAVAVKLWKEGMGWFDENEGRHGQEGWLVSSDVSPDNKESTGVCRSLGGEAGWEVYWVRVDLSRLGKGGGSE